MSESVNLPLIVAPLPADGLVTRLYLTRAFSAIGNILVSGLARELDEHPVVVSADRYRSIRVDPVLPRVSVQCLVVDRFDTVAG
ncbi:MAG: hypothetical protein ABIJ00_07795 [Candidatus Eisenbacteria bacterium]